MNISGGQCIGHQLYTPYRAFKVHTQNCTIKTDKTKVTFLTTPGLLMQTPTRLEAGGYYGQSIHRVLHGKGSQIRTTPKTIAPRLIGEQQQPAVSEDSAHH